MKPGLQLRTAQGLALTPQLQQSIRLLQLSTQELQQELQQALAENPFLELAEESEDRGDADAASPDTASAETEELSWQQAESGDGTEEGLQALPSGEPALTDSVGGAEAGPSQEIGEEGSHTLTDAAAVLADNAAPGSAGPEEDGESELWQHGQDSGSDAGEAQSPDPADSNDAWEPDSSYPSTPAGNDDGDWQDSLQAASSLAGHLEQQARALRLDPQEQAALQCLIDSLDERGWLADPLEELADSLLLQLADDDTDPVEQRDELLHLLTIALRLLQAMEPTGVGARDLAECLRLQLNAETLVTHPATPAARLLLDQPLELLARRDVRTLARESGQPADAVKAALQLIATLEPQPARRFANPERDVIVPDVLVRRMPARSGAAEWQVQLYTDALPRLQVQERYASLLRQHRSDNAEALQQQLNEARWLVRSLQQRQETLLRVSEAIVQRQARFFAEGPLAMQPLVMREIADTLGLHESTISRVSSGKYLHTPWGTFELKHFFGSGLASDDGTATSSTAVRTLIAQWIAEEPDRKPLSDSRLCELLQERGIQCARRTVAKYREQLRIPPAHLRKRLD